MILWVVDPVLERYADIKGGDTVQINSTEPPSQNSVGPLGITAGVGFGLTVTLTGEEVPVHPFASVTVTVKVPLTTTLML